MEPAVSSNLERVKFELIYFTVVYFSWVGGEGGNKKTVLTTSLSKNLQFL